VILFLVVGGFRLIKADNKVQVVLEGYDFLNFTPDDFRPKNIIVA
jgi:hypothetical protein